VNTTIEEGISFLKNNRRDFNRVCDASSNRKRYKDRSVTKLLISRHLVFAARCQAKSPSFRPKLNPESPGLFNAPISLLNHYPIVTVDS